MLQKPLLAAALALAGSSLAAAQTQPAQPVPKSKPGRAVATAAPAAAPALATDWSVSYAASITPEDLRKHLSVLASDEYEGRETGQRGQKMAAEYLSKQFAELGLAGPVKDSDNPYLQHFTLNRVDPAAAVKVGNRTFAVNEDFYVSLRNAATVSAAVQPTFVGYGISTAGYADFAPAAADLQGKDLVMLLGEPLRAGQPLLGKAGQASPYGAAGFPEMAARSPALLSLAPRSSFRIAPSAAAFAQVPQDYVGLFGGSKRQDYAGLFRGSERMAFPDEPAPAGKGPNLFIVSPAMGAAMLGTTAAGLAKYRRAVAAAGKPVASPFKPVALQAVEKKASFTTENVLGYLEGSDKQDEVLVITAHYDHVGTKNGVVYNGADDNGSGTASVLALARAFSQAKKDGHGPRRSILFLANTGEEKDLLGSEYYATHPIFPLQNTVTVLNIDMLGRVDSVHTGKGNYVYVVGDDRLSSELHALSEATNRQYTALALDYRYNAPNDPEHLYRRSDHYSFAKRQVPVIYYTSGLHPQYHQPADDVARIDFPALARRAQLVFHTAWALANRDNRVAVDSNKP